MKKCILLFTLVTTLVNANVEPLLSSFYRKLWYAGGGTWQETIENTKHVFKVIPCPDRTPCYVDHQYYCEKITSFSITELSDTAWEVACPGYKTTELSPDTIKTIADWSGRNFFNFRWNLEYEVELANSSTIWEQIFVRTKHLPFWTLTGACLGAVVGYILKEKLLKKCAPSFITNGCTVSAPIIGAIVLPYLISKTPIAYLPYIDG